MSGGQSGSMSDFMLSYANLVLRGSTKRRNENVPSRLIQGTPHLEEDRRRGLPRVAGWAGVSWYLEVFRWKSVVNPQKFSRCLGSDIHSLTKWELAHSGRGPGFGRSNLVSCDQRYCSLPSRTSILTPGVMAAPLENHLTESLSYFQLCLLVKLVNETGRYCPTGMLHVCHLSVRW